MSVESDFYSWLLSGVKSATSVNVVKGYPSWNRDVLKTPIISVMFGPSDNAQTKQLSGTYPIRQQWVVIVFGSNEVEKIELVSVVRNWLRSHQNYNGKRVTYVRGEPHVMLTDQQAEQYAYDIFMEVEL